MARCVQHKVERRKVNDGYAVCGRSGTETEGRLRAHTCLMMFPWAMTTYW